MGVPKRRVSHARQGERRAHHALTIAAAGGVPALPPAEAGRTTPARTAAGTAAARPCASASARSTEAGLLKPSARAPSAGASALTRWTSRSSAVAATPSPRCAPARRGRRHGRRPRARGGRRGARRLGSRRIADADLILVGDEARIEPLHRRRAARRTSRIVQALGVGRHGRAGRGRGPPQARREHQRLHAPRPRGRGGRGRHRRSHRRRRRVGDPQPRAPAGRRPAGARHPDGHRQRPVHAPRHRRDDRLDRPQPRPVRAHGRALRGARAGRRRARPSRCCPSARRGQGRAARPGGDRAAERPAPALHRQRRGQGPAPPSRPTSSSATRRSATSSSSSSRACRRVIFDHAPARSSSARPGARIGYLFMRPGIGRIRRASTTSGWAARRCSASRAPCSSPTAAPSGG